MKDLNIPLILTGALITMIWKKYVLLSVLFRYPAELQIVHVKEDHVDNSDGTVDFSSAYADSTGLAILSIFIQGGADNTTISTSWFDVSIPFIKCTPCLLYFDFSQLPMLHN